MVRSRLLIAALLALPACADHASPGVPAEGQPSIRPAAGPVAAGPVTAPARIEPPTSGPDIRGIVTATDSASVRVEANPTHESGSPKALVRITPATVVLFRNREPTTPEELTLGHNVSVWFVGPVQESYPVQATADTMVIEPIGGV